MILADILIENVANSFDELCNLCIATVGIAAQECGVSYGAMCIYGFIIGPFIWTALLFASSRLSLDGNEKAGRICFRAGVTLVVLHTLFFFFILGCAMCEVKYMDDLQ